MVADRAACSVLDCPVGVPGQFDRVFTTRISDYAGLAVMEGFGSVSGGTVFAILDDDSGPLVSQVGWESLHLCVGIGKLKRGQASRRQPPRSASRDNYWLLGSATVKTRQTRNGNRERRFPK